MSIRHRAADAIQSLFGPLVDAAATASGVIQRQRVFTASSLAQTFVFGFLRHPNASDEQLAQIASDAGTPVSPQAIDQRHSLRLINFFKHLFGNATRIVFGSDSAVAPILERFTSVTLIDSTTITLPDCQADAFPGCGGRHGSGQAALKFQTELDLKTGALQFIQLESGRSADNATTRQHASRGPGSLRISDLGYFCLAVFAAMMRADEHFLTRLQFGTHVIEADSLGRNLLGWLSGQRGPFVDLWVHVGRVERLRCRLIAWKLPAEQANRRRQKLREKFKRKTGKQPTAERLAWCDWTILLTSVPETKVSAKEAAILYGSRWQVELLFKRWKSQGLVAQLSGSTEVRQMVRVWARLLAVLVQHWLAGAGVNGDARVSWSKACECVRGYVGRLQRALTDRNELVKEIEKLAQTVLKTCRLNKRSKAGTNELLNGSKPLNFQLS